MKLYTKYFQILFKSQLEYRMSFYMATIGQFLVSFSGFLSIFFMFSRFNQVEGFVFSEILLCTAVVLLGFSLAEVFVRGFDTFSSIISNGDFDRIMVRPRNEILQVLASKIEFSRIGKAVQAIVLFIYAIPASNVIWTWDKIVTIIFMITGAIALFSGLFVIYATLCFFTIEGLEFINIFTDGGAQFGRYPLAVYGEGVLKFFTYAIPLALVQYYPLLYLLGRSDQVYYMFLPLSGVVFLLIAFVFWKFGVARYKSTGS